MIQKKPILSTCCCTCAQIGVAIWTISLSFDFPDIADQQQNHVYLYKD